MNDIEIRTARPSDAAELREIYAPYVRKTAISFEFEVPTEAEFRARIEKTLKKYPYFVALENGVITGYAYAGPLKERAAYERSVETSIYVRENARAHGIGRALYAALEDALRKQGVTNAYACIAYPAAEDDPHLTTDSVLFHGHMGYELIGHFHKCGHKFGRWYDMVWMEKFLCDHAPIADSSDSAE